MKRYQVIGICLAVGFVAGYVAAPNAETPIEAVAVPEAKPTIVVEDPMVKSTAAGTQVPNAPHSTQMYLLSKEPKANGVVVGTFRVTGYKNGIDSFSKVEAHCGTNSVKDLAYGEGSIDNLKAYDSPSFTDIVGKDFGNGKYEGSTTYNRYRALCG